MNSFCLSLKLFCQRKHSWDHLKTVVINLTLSGLSTWGIDSFLLFRIVLYCCISKLFDKIYFDNLRTNSSSTAEFSCAQQWKAVPYLTKWISKTEILTAKTRLYSFLPVSIRQLSFWHIPFPTKLHLKNGYYPYSACSNPTDVV